MSLADKEKSLRKGVGLWKNAAVLTAAIAFCVSLVAPDWAWGVMVVSIIFLFFSVAEFWATHNMELMVGRWRD